MNRQECKSSFLTPEHFSGAVSEINCVNEDVSNYFKSSLSSISNSSAVIEDMQCKNNFNYFEKDKVKPSQSNLLTVCQNDLVDDLHKPHFKNSRFLPISPCQNSGIFLEEALNVCVDSDESKVQLLTPKNFKEYPVFSNGQFPKCDETYHSKLNSNVLQKQNISSFMSKSEPKSSHHYKSPIAMPQSTRAVPSNLMYEPTKIDIDVVKRKLNFENDIKFTEEEKGTKEFPEFSCNFNVDEKIIEKLTLSDQNSHVQPSLSFQKNPFPPIGVFWDIENCRIPKGSSGTHVVQAIRNRFFDGFKEAEFVCVCDTLKEQPQVLEELNDTQINIIHVGSTVKNAADDKLLQCMRRFADIHGPGSTIVVITGDSDFAVELYDLRYRKKLHVILVHNAHAQDSLKLSAHETALFSDVTQVIPQSSSVLKPKKPRVQNADVYIWNLPSYIDSSLIKRRLQALSANCGAKSFTVHKNYAKIRYHTLEAAIRGRKRIEGTDVFGNRVNCTFERCCEVPAEQNLEYLPLFNGYSDSRSEKYPGFGFNGLRSNYQMDSTPSFRMYNGYNQRYQHPAPVGETGNNSWKNWRSSYGPRNTNGPYSGHAMDSYPMNYNNGSNRCSSYFSKRRERSSESPYSSEEAGCETYPEYVNSPSQSPVNEFDPYENATSTGSETTSQSVNSELLVPVELIVSNLDPTIESRRLTKTLLAAFSEVTPVLQMSLFGQSDGNIAASVTVSSFHDAQFAISQLHRKRIGVKRIVLSYASRSHRPTKIKRLKILALLKEVPGKKLPLFKFRELYERRYQEAIGVSELNSLRDIVTVSDNCTGRMISLNTECRSLASLMEDASMYDPNEQRFCKKHFQPTETNVGWAEVDFAYLLPRVRLSLKELSSALGRLMSFHSGSLPLASLMDCYSAEIAPLTPDADDGVSIEHLISCIPEFEIFRKDGFKYIKKLNEWSNNLDDELQNICPQLVGNTVLFSKELVDLLKTYSHCEILVTKFISAYYYHYGRQCRVADYGFTRLLDLLEALPHLVQIMGDGSKMTMTLTYRCQVKRFSSDLLRVLKAQPTKTVAIKDFGKAFEKVVGRSWNVSDYGVCEIGDLVKELKETAVVVKQDEVEGTVVAIPKREQTPEEIKRTQTFATECVELLRHSPQCKMKFNRFIPSYHHHFGTQCRVADFGFTKLIEMFEVIPKVVQIIEDEDGERTLQLTKEERLKVLGDQIFTLVKNSPNGSITVPVLASVFTKFYGYCLRPEQYDCDSVVELISKMNNYVQVDMKDGIERVALVDRTAMKAFWEKCRSILWEEADCSLALDELMNKFSEMFDQTIGLEEIERDLSGYLEILHCDSGVRVQLNPLQKFIRSAVVLLGESGGRMLLSNFESVFQDRFGVSCNSAAHGFSSVQVLLLSVDSLFSIMGKKPKQYVVLNKEAMNKLPKYSPPIPTRIPNSVREKPKWNNFSCSNVHPSSLQNGPVPQSQSIEAPPPPPPTPPCGQNKLWGKDYSGSHLVMGVTPPQQSFHQPPVIYSGSPTPPNGTIVWGQVWSPPYSVISPVSPAPYMMPSVPLNWTSVPNVHPSSAPQVENADPANEKYPVSLYSLEQGTGREATPPSANELPSPDFLKSAESKFEIPESSSEAVPPHPDEQRGVKGCGRRLAMHFNADM